MEVAWLVVSIQHDQREYHFQNEIGAGIFYKDQIFCQLDLTHLAKNWLIARSEVNSDFRVRVS
jgi:hypothetical protein